MVWLFLVVLKHLSIKIYQRDKILGRVVVCYTIEAAAVRQTRQHHDLSLPQASAEQ
jgi:hypothetical protein